MSLDITAAAAQTRDAFRPRTGSTNPLTASCGDASTSVTSTPGGPPPTHTAVPANGHGSLEVCATAAGVAPAAATPSAPSVILRPASNPASVVPTSGQIPPAASASTAPPQALSQAAQASARATGIAGAAGCVGVAGAVSSVAAPAQAPPSLRPQHQDQALQHVGGPLAATTNNTTVTSAGLVPPTNIALGTSVNDVAKVANEHERAAVADADSTHESNVGRNQPDVR